MVIVSVSMSIMNIGHGDGESDGDIDGGENSLVSSIATQLSHVGAVRVVEEDMCGNYVVCIDTLHQAATMI